MGFFIFFFYQRNTNRHLYCEFTQHFHTNYIFFFKNHKNEIFANLNREMNSCMVKVRIFTTEILTCYTLQRTNNPCGKYCSFHKAMLQNN